MKLAEREWAPRGASMGLRALWMGALASLLLPLVATAVYLQTQDEPWTARSTWLAHRSHPLLWLIDLAPLALVTVAGLFTRARVQRVRLEADERRLGFDVLTRVAQHAIVVADSRDRIVEWSPGAEDTFGYTSEQIVGEPLDCLIEESGRESLSAEIARARQQLDHGGRFVLQGLKQDGRKVAVEISLACWQTSAGQMLGAVLHDISKQVLAERRLGEVEKNWRDIAQNSSDVLLLLDRAGTIIFANRGPLNRPLEAVIGSDVAQLVPDLLPVVEPALHSVFDSGAPYQCEGKVTDADGQTHWWWCRFAAHREDGEVVRAVLSISDIGDRLERDVALRRLAGIVERTRDAVLTTDERGRVRSWNAGAELLWGYRDVEIIGQSVAVLCPPDLLEEQTVVFERLRDGRHVGPYDSLALAQNRRRIPVSVSVAATRNEAGQFQGLSAVVRDMSYHQELQDALEMAKAEAERANQLKSEFLANMSHEVRTPLNGVVGMVDLLRSTPLSPDQESYVVTLLEATQALRAIVDDVLDFSRIEAGQLKIDKLEFDLVALASNAVDMFRHAARQNYTELRLAEPVKKPVRVVGDPNRIRQVLVNLLNNAVKFTKNGGIDVRVFAQARGEVVTVRCEIEDTGVGIEHQAQSVIFQPFKQADGSITRRFGGTGLGLSICRHLIDLMGGHIGFQSQLGVGSLFWFELELTAANKSGQRQRAHPSSLIPKSSTPWRILVAEDNVINQKVIAAMLRGLGCSADIVQNGREALERWEHHGPYDLILMDCQMPIMSGLESASAIREREGNIETRIPIVAMTAQAYAQDRERCARAGMDDHLAKPLTKVELESTLAQWLRLESTAPDGRAPRPRPALTLDTAQLERLESELGDGGKEMLAGLIQGFVVDFAQTLERLTSHVDGGKLEEVSFEAHRARSSTSNLGAVELSRLCERLEECGRRGDASLAAQLVLALREELPRAREALMAFAERSTVLAQDATREATTSTRAAETSSVPS